MSWTTPRTWVAGELVTAALMNPHVRDNLLVLKTKINDAGQLLTMLYQDAAVHVNSGTGETDASTYTLTGGTLATTGQGVRLYIHGKTGTPGGVFTVKVYWNAASIWSQAVTVTNGIWEVESTIVRTGAATQSAATIGGSVAAGLNTATPVAITRLGTVWDSGAPVNATLSSDVALKTTLTATVSGVLTQLYYGVELISAT